MFEESSLDGTGYSKYICKKMRSFAFGFQTCVWVNPMLEVGETEEHHLFQSLHLLWRPPRHCGFCGQNRHIPQVQESHTVCVIQLWGAEPDVIPSCDTRLLLDLGQLLVLGTTDANTVGPPFGRAMGKGKYGIFNHQDNKIITCKWCFV